ARASAFGRKAPADARPIAPLASLVTALSLRGELLSPESRVLLVPYASSVLLLLCLFGLLTKVDGSRVAFVAVLLTCCHREFLELSSRLPPVALGLAFALLAFRGLLAHLAEDERLFSWPLIGAGVAWGTCYLSGGSVALAAWCVLCVQSLVSVAEPSSSLTGLATRRAIRRRLWQGTRGAFAVLVLSLVAAAMGLAWGVLLLWLSRAGLSMGGLWEVGSDLMLVGQPWPMGCSFATASKALISLSGPLLGFVLLGLFQMLPGGTPKAACRGDRFIVVWFGVALLAWLASWTTHGGEFTSSVPWPAFVLLPLLVLAARGLDGVLRRQFDLGAVVVVTLLALVANYALYFPERVRGLMSWEGAGGGLLGVLVAVLVGVWAYRRLSDNERRCRVTLVVCVASAGIADVALGLSSLPQPTDDERELLAFRRQLSVEPRPAECWLISDEAPPARLRFFLRSFCRDGSVHWAKDWEGMFVDVAASPAIGRGAAVDGS
ncbi:MAG TPA: hypothetical protein VK137_00755, partial [Planctomycetaceae bacterium]|nr:hypothetical protein [Planctomycetaceae bacterium]